MTDKERELEEFERLEASLLPERQGAAVNGEDGINSEAQSTPVDKQGGPKVTSNVKRRGGEAAQKGGQDKNHPLQYTRYD